MEDILIHFRVKGDEAEALQDVIVWIRRPRDQVRHILRNELIRRGLLADIQQREY